MKDITVQFTAEQNLCISCGVCKGICPHECIRMKKNKGLFVPDVDEDKCVNCGLCTKVCPGLQFDFQGANTLDAIKGPVIDSFNAWSKEPLIRHMSASGGVISSLIRELLKLGEYDVVFNLDTYNYDTQLKLKAKDKEYYNAVETKKDKTLKSRYLPVSHEDVVKYIKSNPDGKAIIIGTSCALQGITKAIRILKKDRENYLLIGLFCDKVFNYNVIDYFKSRKFSKGKDLSELHFKNKDSGGWPGDMKFIFSDESTCFYKGSIRLGLKEFFTPERCVYCIDKLNIVADISIGDNFTSQDSSPLGSNSVIIRTQKGSEAWRLASSVLECKTVSLDEIIKAQSIKERAKNNRYAKVKEKQVYESTGMECILNDGVSVREQYDESDCDRLKETIETLCVGIEYNKDPGLLKKALKEKKRKRQKQMIEYYVGIIKRKLKI